MENWELFKVKGIPVRIHSSWLVIFFIFAWSAQEQISNSNLYQLPLLLSWTIGFITSFLLFLSVLLHELGHSLMAIHEGVKVRSITLFFLGGIAKVERECSTPMACFRVALAGPLVSFVISLLLLGSVQILVFDDPIISNLFKQLGSLNLVIAIFNLLPGLPLDGGIILKSLVWHFTGSQRKGIKVATNSGRFFSLASIFFGTWICFSGGGLAGLWLIILGWFGIMSSRSQDQMLTFQKALCDLKVENLYGRKYRILESDLTLRKFSELDDSLIELESGPMWNLVYKEGRSLGYITVKTLKELPVQHWDSYLVGDYLTPLENLPSISQKDPLWKAVLLLEKTPHAQLLVMNLAGLPIGTFDRINAGESVLKKIGLNIPEKLLNIAEKKNIYPLGMALPQIVDSMISSGLVEESYELSSKK